MGTESLVADPAASYENVLTGMLHVLSRASIVWGVGNLESTKTMSLEMLVIGNDIAGALGRAQQGVRVDDETLAVDLIQELGHKAEYLEHPHTLAHFKGEYYFPRVTNRRPRGTWEALGSPTIVEEAQSRIEALRSLPTRTVVSAAQRKELLAIERKWTEKLT
ncbi:MAG: trimethylamine methyltransferase family protein [Planctomycetes bacterium]|nr:trimethylamine methyltransferase family protein [Planctomycetota bacterium]